MGDITSAWTAEGALYLALLLDLYSRKVVGWAMSQRVDATLVQEALQRALERRQPARGLMHHSDRGSQYACGTYQALLAARGIRCRMSRMGEHTSLHYYATHWEARDDVIDDIELFYNSKRLRSYPECRSQEL